jgi:ATP synthase protein I
MNTIAKPPLLRMTGIQLLILMAVALVCLPFGRYQALSFLAGGLIHIAGGTYFAMLSFRHRGATRMANAIQLMYRGEMGKIVLTGALFVLVFVTVEPLEVVALFAGYGLMIVVHAITTGMILKQYFP